MNNPKRVQDSKALDLMVGKREIWAPWWLGSEESTCNAGDAGDAGSIPGSGRSPGGGHGNPLQYSCLENPMDRGAWSPWGLKET